MKKIISVLLSLLIAISVFSIGAFAVEAETEPTRLEKWVSNYEGDDGLAVKINLYLDGFLIGFIKSNVYCKGDNLAMTVDFDGREIKVVSKDDNFLIFLTKFPFMHYRMKSESVFGSVDTDFSDCSFVKAYEHVYEEKAFWVEEYTFESDGEKYQVSAYFEGDELKKITVGQKITDMDMEIEFEILSYEVDDDMFKMPLISLDVTFLVDLLLKIGLL